MFTVAIIAIFSYRRYITSMQINRNPCTHMTSNINTCITIRKPIYSCFEEPCMHPAGGFSIKMLLQVTILMLYRYSWAICSFETFSRSLRASWICSTKDYYICKTVQQPLQGVCVQELLLVSLSLQKWLQYKLTS